MNEPERQEGDGPGHEFENEVEFKAGGNGNGGAKNDGGTGGDADGGDGHDRGELEYEGEGPPEVDADTELEYEVEEVDEGPEELEYEVDDADAEYGAEEADDDADQNEGGAATDPDRQEQQDLDDAARTTDAPDPGGAEEQQAGGAVGGGNIEPMLAAAAARLEQLQVEQQRLRADEAAAGLEDVDEGGTGPDRQEFALPAGALDPSGGHPPGDDEYIGLVAAAAEYGLTAAELDEHFEKQRIRAFRDDHSRKFLREELDALKKQLEQERGAEDQRVGDDEPGTAAESDSGWVIFSAALRVYGIGEEELKKYVRGGEIRAFYKTADRIDTAKFRLEDLEAFVNGGRLKELRDEADAREAARREPLDADDELEELDELPEPEPPEAGDDNDEDPGRDGASDEPRDPRPPSPAAIPSSGADEDGRRHDSSDTETDMTATHAPFSHKFAALMLFFIAAALAIPVVQSLTDRDFQYPSSEDEYTVQEVVVTPPATDQDGTDKPGGNPDDAKKLYRVSVYATLKNGVAHNFVYSIQSSEDLVSLASNGTDKKFKVDQLPGLDITAAMDHRGKEGHNGVLYTVFHIQPQYVRDWTWWTKKNGDEDKPGTDKNGENKPGADKQNEPGGGSNKSGDAKSGDRGSQGDPDGGSEGEGERGERSY